MGDGSERKKKAATGAVGAEARSSVIDEAEVRRIAGLARLELSDDEVAMYAEQMSRIVGYVERLQELDLEDAAPLAHPLDGFIELDEDKPREGLGNEALMKMAPASEAGFVRVPKVIGGGSGG